MLKADDKETPARSSLLLKARERMREQGRRGLKRRPVRPRRPEQQIREYRAALRRVVRAIEQQIRERVFTQLEGLLSEAGTRDDDARADDWGAQLADLFAATRSGIRPAVEQAEQTMTSLGDETKERATDDVKRQIRSVLGVAPDFFDQDQIGGLLNEWKRNNAAFITKFSDDSISEAQDIVSRAVRSGRPAKEIRKELRAKFKISENRAARIARTEVSQLNTQVARNRQTELGIEKYIWRTSRDERVREEHRDRAGKRYSWDSPPEGGHPGEPINCRCEPQADTDSLLDELEAS